ncbi:MAG: trimethylamine methyltransferase family protein [Candidatus Hodarchaeota archaeon]
MKLNQIEVLSKEDIENIHTSTLELIEKVGVRIDDDKTRKLFHDYGAEIDNKHSLVKIPESLIKEKLRQVPNSFQLFGPDGSYNIEINTNNIHFAPIGAAVKMFDPSYKNQIRKSILNDTVKQLRLVDQLDHLSCSQIDFWPGDVKYTTIHTVCIYNWAKNSHKPYGHGCFGKTVSEDSIKMTAILAGGEQEIINRPRLFGIFNPTSPLHLPKIMTNGLEVFAKFKQPTVIAPEALAGTSAPVTLAGLLTQTNAEILSGIILSQIYNPTTPVFYGSVSHITDMRTGNSAIGSIETGLITTGIAQLAKFYNIPSRALGGVTDSKCLDIQNGIERFQTLMFAALSGINFITCAGTYEATLSGALELTIIDNEIAGMIKRALEGIDVNDETIGLGIIEKVTRSGIKGATFLSEKHTREFMKKEFFIPQLMDRNRRTTWRKKGNKDLTRLAAEKVSDLLENFNEYKIPKDKDNELKIYMRSVDKRTYDDYAKLEGISSKGVTLPTGKELKTNDK